MSQRLGHPIALLAGEHHLTAEGAIDASQAVDVSAGARVSVRFSWEAAEPEAPLPPRTDPEPSAAGGSSAWPWLPILSGVVLAALGGAGLGVALADRSALESLARDDVSFEDIRGTYDGVPVFSSLGIAGLTVGGAAMVAGFLWLAVGDGASAIEVAVSPSRLLVRGRF